MNHVFATTLRLLALAALVVLGLSGATQGGETPSLAEQVAVQLRAQGYDRIESGRSWLGRIWVRGQLGDTQREIVLNPNTGEILRDYTMGEVRVAERDDDDSTPGQTVVAGGTVTATLNQPGIELLDTGEAANEAVRGPTADCP